MSRTFAFIGSRPDLASVVVRAHEPLLAVRRSPESALAWGAGYFQKDEVLLRRRPEEHRDPVPIAEDLKDLRTHSLLAHVCDTKQGLRTETTPPLRYGHLLFACQGPEAQHAELRAAVASALPEFLLGNLKGDTFTELAFSLFLAALPAGTLATARDRAPARRAAPLDDATLRNALRDVLQRLDSLCDTRGVPRFDGDLWLQSGEFLMVAHRKGMLGLRIYKGRSDFATLGADEESHPNLDQARFAAAISGPETLPVGWERLPDEHLLTATRTSVPETERI